MAEKIEITFLGTSGAIPTARRNHPAVLLKYKDENILFDCGEGTQRQFRKAKLNPCKITKILISHWHADHVLGIPGFLQTLMLNGYNKRLTIYGPRGTKNFMDKYLELFVKKGEKISMEIKEIDEGDFLETDEFVLSSEKTDHDTRSLAYSFTIKEKKRLDKTKLKKLKVPNGPLLGELASGKTIKLNGKKIDGKKLHYTEQPRKISYIIDTRYSKDLEKFAKDSDLIICESTYGKDEGEIANNHGHLTSHQAATIAKKSKSKKLALLHLSQRYDAIPKKILEEAKEIFKETIVPEDLGKLEV